MGQVSSIKDAKDAFAIYFLVGKPSDAALSDAYEQAMSILRKAPSSNVIEESMADQFSEQVAQAIAQHQAHLH
jgi:hypothetical protein